MSPFPSTVALSEASYVEDKISVICHCHMPEKGKMIQCSQCKEWIHQACEKATPCRAWTERMFFWYCKYCKKGTTRKELVAV